MIRRLLLSALAGGLIAQAAPPLTTIQDVLYKADGSRFNGSATITWTSFEAIDRSAIATQSTTVKILDGNLRVQLVPTTGSAPATHYSVRFTSDGKAAFEETWFVPSSLQPLRLRDIRVVTPAAPPSAESTIMQGDVVGLPEDLTARPAKGLAYRQGRVVYANAQGGLDSVSGLASDCVRVDGSSGPCADPPPQFIDSETPVGAVDGYNRAFTLSGAPNPAGSLTVYRNGILQRAGVDYTASGSTLTFAETATPQPGDILATAFRLGTVAVTHGQPAFLTFCNLKGTQTLAANMALLGTCRIGAGHLEAGDRLDVRVELEHTGAVSAFSFALKWDDAVVLQGDGAAGDTVLTLRAEASIAETGAVVTSQFWGTLSQMRAAVAAAAVQPPSGGTISVLGKLAESGDSLNLLRLAVYRWR